MDYFQFTLSEKLPQSKVKQDHNIILLFNKFKPRVLQTYIESKHQIYTSMYTHLFKFSI